MRAHSINYLRRDGRPKGHLVSVGFWVFNAPRPLLLCRLLGHKAVIDGVGDPSVERRRRGLLSRWVCCDRCGERPEPQGYLNPFAPWHRIGLRYRGRFNGTLPDRDKTTRAHTELVAERQYSPPGPWPRKLTGELGGQLVIGGAVPSVGFGVKVGHGGSEETLACHLHLGKLGALYLHTERFGTWWQRRLNPVGYHSRVIEVEVDTERLRWRLWVRRDESSASTPKWMDGSVRINPFDLTLGPKRYAYENVGDPVTATVRLPHGDDHQVTLQLQRVLFGRKRWRKRQSWAADWDARPGIDTKPHGGAIWGSGVKITDSSGRRDHADPYHEHQWVLEACAAIAVQITGMRTRSGYHPFPTERTDA